MIDFFEVAKSIVRAYQVALDLESGRLTKCHNCHKPLTDDEIRGAIQEGIKEPICDGCYTNL